MYTENAHLVGCEKQDRIAFIQFVTSTIVNFVLGFVSTFAPSAHFDFDAGFFQNNTLSVEEREGSYAKLVNAYYELATLFYEWGWGSSFHFASRWRGETFQESIKVREIKP